MGEGKLSAMIKKAIHDCEITTKEYDQILALVHEDGKVDSEEKRLLAAAAQGELNEIELFTNVLNRKTDLVERNFIERYIQLFMT
jgi:hypothetical protein